MAQIVYVLGVMTTLLCAILLLRAFIRVRQRLLLWSGLCFACLTISNMLVFADMVLFPDLYLYRWRLGTATVAMSLLIYGLIWEDK